MNIASKMIIIGIDPGPEESAYVILDSDRIKVHGKLSNENLKSRIKQYLANRDATVAIEMISSYGMPVGREVFNTCIWIGRLIEQFYHEGYDYMLITRSQIKSVLCNKQKSNDAIIRKKLIEIYGEPGTKKKTGPTYGITGDVWSALAVAHVSKILFDK